MNETTLLILAALAIVALVILILRSRSRNKSETGHHIDTSVTAVGAATEAVRNIVEDVAQRVEDTIAPDAVEGSAKVEAKAKAEPIPPVKSMPVAKQPEAIKPAAKKPAVKAEASKPAAKAPAVKAEAGKLAAKTPAVKAEAGKPAAKAPAVKVETKKASSGKVALTGIGVPAAVGAPDDLRSIKGLGPKLNGVLTDLGITRYDQIAAWGDAEIAKVDAHLGTFKGRITRDNWIEQAKLLAKGDKAGFEAKFGKL